MLRNNRRPGQRMKRRTRYTVLILAVIAIAAVYRFSAGSSVKSAGESIPNHEMPAGKHIDTEYRGVHISDIDISDELMLVNSDYKLDEDFAADLSSAYRMIPLSTSDIKINGTVLEAVGKLFAEAEKMGYKDFFVNSGYRSFQKQKEIYDSAEEFSNAVKYSMSGTRVYADMTAADTAAGSVDGGAVSEGGSTAGEVSADGMHVFTLKNISKDPLNISADELTEQFVRGDRARYTEGNGLGLYIAKNLTEAMGGRFSININGDLFEVQIAFKAS